MAKKQGSKQTTSDGAQVLVRNRRASHDYQIHETVEAGIVLVGSEVKALREAKGSLGEAYAEIRDGEAWLVGAQVNEYKWANQFNHDPQRRRKLLLHKHQIRRLGIKTQQRGFTLVPLSMYLKDGKVKVELALATGKRFYEKREASREADARRELDREIKSRLAKERAQKG
jgi:SsrA-binding protein